jgi:hypothetical protein
MVIPSYALTMRPAYGEMLARSHGISIARPARGMEPDRAHNCDGDLRCQFLPDSLYGGRPAGDQLLSVEFDEDEVRVVAHGQMDASWNQSFRWKDIERVCFTDEGLYSSDRISVELKGGPKPVIILTEVFGGNEFFGAVTERGYFPEEVWRKAMGGGWRRDVLLAAKVE